MLTVARLGELAQSDSGAHAQLLGPIKIGANSKIGAGAIVLDSVPAHVTAVGNPAHLVATQLHAYHEATSNQA